MSSEKIPTTRKQNFHLRTSRRRERGGRGGAGAPRPGKPLPRRAGGLTSRRATRQSRGMNQSADGSSEPGRCAPSNPRWGVRSPASRSIHVAQGRRAGTGLCARDPRRSRGADWLGRPEAAFPGSGSAARPRWVAGRPADRGERIPPPRTGRAPGPHAAPRLPRLRIARADPIPAGTRLPDPGERQGQSRSRPRVCGSAGPRQCGVGARRAGQGRPGAGSAERRLLAVAAASSRPHWEAAIPRRLRALPRAWPFGPYIPAGPAAGRGAVGGARGGSARLGELPPGSCSSDFPGAAEAEQLQEGLRSTRPSCPPSRPRLVDAAGIPPHCQLCEV